MQPDTPCTHADAGEALGAAVAEWKAARAAIAGPRFCPPDYAEIAARLKAADDAICRYTRCPDCGQWREGA